MFDSVRLVQHDDHRFSSGFAASVGLHGAIIGAIFALSRLLVANVVGPASAPISFPAAPKIAFSLHPSAAPRAVTHRPHSVARGVHQPTDKARPSVTPAVVDTAASDETSDETSDDNSAEAVGTGPGSASGSTDGVAHSGTGTGEYLRLSHAPRRLSGEDEPALAPSLLMQLRGSKAVVLARISINARGEVDDVQIVKSTAPAPLDDAIRRFIRATWRFEAPSNAGRPAAVQYLQSFRFSF